VKITVAVEIGERTVVEQMTTKEDFRGDYRAAITEAVTRIELSTFGPQMAEGNSFDEQLKMRPQS
jgi:hypothetical protein